MAVASGRGKMRRRGENRGNIQYNIFTLVNVSNGLLTYYIHDSFFVEVRSTLKFNLLSKLKGKEQIVTASFLF